MAINNELIGSDISEQLNALSQQAIRTAKNLKATQGKGVLIRNHDKRYDYFKTADGRLLTRRKGTNNWIDISDNNLAVSRINSYLSKPKDVKQDAPKDDTKKITTTKSAAEVANEGEDEQAMIDAGYVKNDKGFWVKPPKPTPKETPKVVPTSKNSNDTVTGHRRGKTPKSTSKSKPKTGTRVVNNPNRFHYSEEITQPKTTADRYKSGEIGLIDYVLNTIKGI